MEYQSNEEVENLQRQLREEENRTSLAHDEIRRLHRVCQAKDDEISELQENTNTGKPGVRMPAEKRSILFLFRTVHGAC